MKILYLNCANVAQSPFFTCFFFIGLWATALLSGPAAAHAQTIITQWNFNSNPADANTGTGITAPSTGTGMASLAGSSTSTFASGDANGGSTDPATGDDSGWNVTTFAAQGTADRSQGAQFLVSTAGFQNINVRWDQRHSNTAPRHVQLQYTTNGSTWTDFGSPFLGTAGDTWFNNRSADLSAITAANNNPNFGIRIVAAFAPATSAYAASNATSSYSTTGTWRLDMVTVTGTPLCISPVGTLSNSGPICPGGTVDLTFNATVGTGPFNILVNGTDYPNVSSGIPFATLTEGINFSGNTTFTLSDIADANNCQATGLHEQTTVTVSTSSNVVITATPNPVGQGNTLNLSVSSTGAGATYNWSGSGVVNANANTTTAVPAVGGSQTYAVTVTNASNCVSTGTVSVLVIPAVTLSVSTNAGTEAASTAVTVTATASAPVSGNQTVTLGVSGAGITAADYYLSRTTLTILSGQTTATAIFTIADDGTTEGPETATLTLASPSTGIVLGSPFSQNIAITDNPCGFLRKIGGITSANGAEIPAFDPSSQRVYVVAGPVVEIFSMSGTGALTLVGTLPFGFTPPGGTTALPNSVAVKNGIVAVSYAIVTSGSNAQQPGRVGFYTASTGAFLNVVATGALPDMVVFSPDGMRALTADEGEPNSYGQGNSLDPEGSVSIIDLSGGVAAATVQVVGFSAFNPQIAALRAAGVRIYGPGATVAQDLEPEYIAFSPDGLTARVTLQENNAIAVLDLASATFTSIQPLGLKNHNTPGNGLDASDQDGPSVNIQNWPVFGMYEPDAIVPYTVGGQTYYITANEGDSRAYTGFNEEIRVGAAGYVLDPAAFPNAATLKMNANLGRLQLTNATGNTDGDGDFDQIQALGARSFSIWASNGNQVFDSGDQLEQITAAKSPTLYNSDGALGGFDSRSDNKGPEPEGVAVGTINGITYAFIGLERTGDVMVYDVTNPVAPVFVQYMNLPEDLGVEGLVFVPAANSPTGNALLITTAEVSRTVTVYEIGIPTIQIAVAETSGVAPNDGIICSNNSAMLTASGAASYQWSTNDNTAATTVNTAGIYTVTATNSNGCPGTATFSLTVNPAPSLSLSGATSFCAGGSTVLTAAGNPTNYLWNTTAVSSSITVTAGGTYTVTVNGSNGCFATASATVVANPLPTVTCPANLTVCIANPVFPLAGSIPAGGTYSGAGVNAGQFDPVAAGVGTHTITYAYTDGNGCFGTCTYTITVHPQPNTLISAAGPVPANSTGNTASVENAGAGATYAWSIVNGTITNGTGTSSITYTAGASGTVELSVMITNVFCSIPGTANISIAPAPQFSCPPSIVRTTSADGNTGNCVFNGMLAHPATSGPNTPITLAIGFSNGSPAPSALPTGGTVTAGTSGTYGFFAGKTVVRYTATDNLSNAATCSFTVQVTDNELPSIVCPANIVRNNNANQCGAAVTYATPTVSDNCSVLTPVRTGGPASGAFFPKGTTMVNWRVTDVSGNSALCGFTVTVNDAQAPTIACPTNQTKGTDLNQCAAAVTYANPTASDNCTPAPTVTLQSPTWAGSGAAFPKGQTTVVWRATDAAGLTKTCTFRVTVNDTQAPSIACPLSRTVNTDANVCTAATAYATPTFTDNCAGGLVSLISGLPSGATFPKGTTNVTWRAMDAAGLIKTCSFAVTVLDNQAPTIACPASVTATAAPGECSTEVTYTAPTATDNCGSIQGIFLLSGLTSGSVFPQGNNVNVWRATDGNGLSRTCLFTVTVNCGTGAQGLSDRTENLTPNAAVSGAELEALNFRLAPNPASTEVQILMESPLSEGAELAVYDAQGRSMWKQTLPAASQTITLALADLPAGLYFVALRAEKAVVTKRLSVSRL